MVIESAFAGYELNSPFNLPYAIAGQGDFTLIVHGKGFAPSSVIEWDGVALPTIGGSTDLNARISAAMIAKPGKVVLTVRSGSLVSNPFKFHIASPAAATAGVVALVSAAPDGSPANGDSLMLPSISSTGRYVAFQSNATNLTPGPASGFQEIYLRDTCIGAPPGCVPSTVRITVTHDGSPVNGHSRMSAVSADGRYVAFDSSATNILPGVTLCSQFDCVFLRDTCRGAPAGCTPTTSLISTTLNNNPAGGGYPAITPDGRFVALCSTGTSPGISNVYVRDTCNGATTACTPSTTLVSVSLSGVGGNANSLQQAISHTGRYLAFLSWATNMVPNQGVRPGIFWRDTCLGATSPCTPTTLRVDVTETGAQPNDFAVLDPFPGMSADGRLVAFGSGATNLVSGNVPAGNLYVRDTCNGASTGCTPTTFLVSVANDGSIGNCGSPGHNGGTSMSADGRFVAFGSIATNLTPDDNFPACGWEDIFVRDTCFGVTSGCTPSTVRVCVANFRQPGTSANSLSSHAAMSADGHYVVFLSSATNLLPTPTNGRVQVFLAKTGF